MADDQFLQQVVDFCRKKLDSRAKSYLVERQITDPLIERFQIGFCPSETKDMLTELDPVKLREIGFIKNASHCYFSNRVIFPTWDQYGKVVGIAGRVLPEFFTGKRKYFNTNYAKGKVLYGLNFAIPEILKKSEVIVTEGYIDVVTAFQYGVKNIVCTCGTTLTADHLMLLGRYAEVIKLLYDADAAGIKAMARILEKDYTGLKIDSVLLDEDEDVDSYLRKYGTEKFLAKVHETEDEYLRIRVG